MPLIELTAADGHALSAYSAGPADAKAGLVVVQEIFGVNHHMRNVADKFAAEGFAVVSPALFDRTQRGVELGYTPEDVAEGLRLRAKIDANLTVLDILAAAAALPKGVKRGIVGYCWGGTIAWHGATRTSAFAASSCWYGGGIAAAKDEVPRCAVQMHFGEVDHSIPLTDVDAVRSAQPGVDTYIYSGAGHGFGCDERGSFVAEDAARAQRRTLAFFTANLA